MKIRKYVAVLIMALSVVACNKNDDAELELEYAQNVVGDYNGSMALSVSDKLMGTVEGLSLDAIRMKPDSIQITLGAFNFSNYSIPQIITGSKLIHSNGKYLIEGKLNTTSESFNISGNFSGETDGKAISLTFTFLFGEMPMPVVGVYGGSQAQGSMTVNTSDYNTWTYINLKTGETQVHRDFSAWNYLNSGNLVETIDAVGSEPSLTINWDIAIHRYDIKTNGGAALATSETIMNNVTTIPTTGYKEDVEVENTIITDMTGMMSGKIGYASKSKYNSVLSEWLTRTPTGTMPPYTYKPTNLIYLLKSAAGNYIKLKFTDNTNAEGASGHVTFSYEYIVD